MNCISMQLEMPTKYQPIVKCGNAQKYEKNVRRMQNIVPFSNAQMRNWAWEKVRWFIFNWTILKYIISKFAENAWK